MFLQMQTSLRKEDLLIAVCLPHYDVQSVPQVLLCFGCGCVAQSVLSGKQSGDSLSIHLGWGMGVLLGALVSGQKKENPKLHI